MFMDWRDGSPCHNIETQLAQETYKLGTEAINTNVQFVVPGNQLRFPQPVITKGQAFDLSGFIKKE